MARGGRKTEFHALNQSINPLYPIKFLSVLCVGCNTLSPHQYELVTVISSGLSLCRGLFSAETLLLKSQQN